MHLSFNSLESQGLAERHEHPPALLRAAEADLGARRIYALPPKEWPAVTSRLAPPSALLSPQFRYWAPHTDAVGAPGRVMPSADLYVHRDGDRPTVAAVDGGFEAALFEVVAAYLATCSVDAFKLFAPAQHRPRITCDRLVIARESWTFDAKDLSWAFVTAEAERYAAARAWRTGHGLPEHAFSKLPVEDKPTFVDFTSLVFVNAPATTTAHG
ncbi:hypothetical protein [Streptomyces mesophilus]|uniref:hypothetical protein n=1 Tax=Streptomyces mesophilus TaxID=1775132 RepID=UPI00332071DF